ncbi:hypothetical protein GGI15_001473 [Coemansia interrupta]|uniref:Uncharacterized protein n=1 Tax=Coemansia interrupta TaxID=1126814 RepID=A0A9W8HMR8_9FUNG|nr:hypothetical protein GGI15_001473 [Coemansia interrupta]
MTPARFFEAPEGRWTLAAEFSAEDAANQLQPAIARDVGGDDLCAGASGSDAHPAAPPASAAPLRFGSAGTAMVAGGFIFGGDTRPTAFPAAPAPAAGQPAPRTTAAGPATNRPTFLAVVPTGSADAPLLPPRGAEDAPAAPAGKSVVTKSSSSFVGRLVASDALARWALTPTPTLLLTAPRTLLWATPTGHALLRLDLLTCSALCHAARSPAPGQMDVVAGFVRGHMLVYDAPGARYSRVNKASRWRPDIRCVAWVPGQTQMFVAGAADGWLVLVDRSVEEFQAPGEPRKPGANPVACWRLSHRPLTSLCFAPGGTLAAVTCDNGQAYLVDVLAPSGGSMEQEPFAHAYFGAMTCAAWCPDGAFLVCGGKDDLLGVWSRAGVLLARCHGHDSWVRCVVFDPVAGDQEMCRFVSAGDDGRVCVWELSPAAVQRPRAARDKVPVLLPLVAFRAHVAPITALQVCSDAMVTACRAGTVRVWRRPEAGDTDAYV